jgi:3-isopropylmalate dehydratase small subunit
MEHVLEGKVWKFGDDINTDIISPAEYMKESYEVMGEHAMERVYPGFSKAISKGDFIVAGNNFGSGSSRETAQISLKYAGVGGVIAKSYARIFFRNSINVGLPVVILDEADTLENGDEIRVDLMSGKIENKTKNKVIYGSKLPDNVLEIIRCGGLVNYLKTILKGRSADK